MQRHAACVLAAQIVELGMFPPKAVRTTRTDYTPLESTFDIERRNLCLGRGLDAEPTLKDVEIECGRV